MACRAGGMAVPDEQRLGGSEHGLADPLPDEAATAAGSPASDMRTHRLQELRDDAPDSLRRIPSRPRHMPPTASMRMRIYGFGRFAC
jgi:hypothetical protein